MWTPCPDWATWLRIPREQVHGFQFEVALIPVSVSPDIHSRYIQGTCLLIPAMELLELMEILEEMPRYCRSTIAFQGFS